MISFYFNLFIIICLSYLMSEVINILTKILPFNIKNRLFFLHIKIFDKVTILDIISFMFVLGIILINFEIKLPHNSDF